MDRSGEVKFHKGTEAGWVLFVRKGQSVSMGITALFSLPCPKRAGVCCSMQTNRVTEAP
jgi:hypothetical protein